MKRLLVLHAVLVLLSVAGLATAQESGGPWIPLGSRLDREVRWAIDAGAIRLNPLVRPFRLAAVGAAVREAEARRLPVSARSALSRVRRLMPSPEDSAALIAEIVPVQAYTNARRESFRTGGKSGLNSALGVWASYVSSGVVAVVNAAVDERLRDDPEFTGEKTTEVTGRVQTAYVAVTGRIGDLVFGRMARNWGPDLFDGLLLSNAPYAIEGLTGALRMGRFELTAIAQRLSTVQDASTPRVDFNRYFSAHRLDIRVGRDAWLGLVETLVYGGRGEAWEPALHAPLNLALASQFNDSLDMNSMLGAEFTLRILDGVRVEAGGFIDDIQTDRSSLTDLRPTSYGATMVARLALPRVPLHVAAGYTRISYLAYRNSFEPFFEYSHHRVGLGRNFSDYDQLLLRVSARPSGDWWLGADLSYFRQGSGDFRQPFPSDSVLAEPGYGFLVAPVTRFAAGRLMADGTIIPGIEVGGQVGFTRGASGRTEAIAALSARVAFDILRRRLGGAYPAVERGADPGWP